ncbi:IS30 family transposase [Arthrobacter bambusae]|uniref:IS30 family transposase n=1 Tax=Arthrobacter bambusae TaxID=1338426 RepID=UPI00277F81BD|nr:IS30 family transposase [Arthrobacter bambusae]MDQ0212116.1 hypothetical protein [Arthrobacter bambusae]MDQ0236666.1 hypothetical protein [Arthrobacter bambusae]
MVTLRERKTQYGIIINLPIDHTAARTNAAITAAFAPLPPHLKQTLTWDQGVEMARHQELAAATGIQIYFAERSSPWQRGANENFNGLARQYFRKGTDLSKHTHEYVKSVCNELNTRPARPSATSPPRHCSRPKKAPCLPPPDTLESSRLNCRTHSNVASILRIRRTSTGHLMERGIRACELQHPQRQSLGCLGAR